MIDSESVFILSDDDIETPKFDSLEKAVEYLEKNKLTEPSIYLGVYWFAQLNWEMDNDMVKRIANVGADFCFSGYEIDEPDEHTLLMCKAKK